MPELDAPEMTWVETHRDALIGMEVDAASALVTVAGFRPLVYVPTPDSALGMAYWVGGVTMVCVDGIVKRVMAG